MPATRVGAEVQLGLAVDELVALGAQVDGLDVVRVGASRVRVQLAAGESWPATVVAFDAIGEAQARQVVSKGGRGRKVAVANQISAPARDYLSGRGWSWVDRRVGAHFAGTGRDLEVRYVTRGSEEPGPGPRLASLAADGPIRGKAGLAYAAALLCSPEDPPSFRSVARAVSMTPTAVSNAAALLIEAGLVGPGNVPVLPELFWALAHVWDPLRVAAVASVPDACDAQARTARLDEPGWVLGGDLAAAELGAPVFTLEQRPWLWVPTDVDLRRAERACGPSRWSDRVAVIAVPPTPLVCRWRRPGPSKGTGWPLPHPVFAALELARDPGRGQEILSAWTPDGVTVVWR